jgi:hypothetical protein
LCVLCSPNHHRKFTILIGANFSDWGERKGSCEENWGEFGKTPSIAE